MDVFTIFGARRIYYLWPILPFWTLTDLFFSAVFTIFGPWRIYYFLAFSAILDPDGFIIIGRFHYFGNLTDLLFLAVFTILGP